MFDHRSSVVENNATSESTDLSILRIADLVTASANNQVVVAGIMTTIEASKRSTTVAGKPSWKRDILLVDDSMSKVVCTIWGFRAQTELIDLQNKPVVILDATLNDYNGTRSINAFAGSTILYDPAVPTAMKLKQWYDSNPPADQFAFVSTPPPN